jgi:hypothetical protein
MLSGNKNDQFWQIPSSFPDLTNQNGGIQIKPNWKKEEQKLYTLYMKINVNFEIMW